MTQGFFVPAAFLKERAEYEKANHVNAIGYVPHLCYDPGRLSGDPCRRKMLLHQRAGKIRRYGRRKSYPETKTTKRLSKSLIRISRRQTNDGRQRQASPRACRWRIPTTPFWKGNGMRKLYWFTCICLYAAVIPGCIVIGTSKKHCTDCPQYPEDCLDYSLAAEEIAEIDAVGKLMMSSNRLSGYRRIAGRDTLSEPGQVYLAKTAIRKLMMNSEKEEIFLVLIRNPAFGCTTKRVILARLNSLMMENSKQRVLNAIAERDDCVDYSQDVVVEVYSEDPANPSNDN